MAPHWISNFRTNGQVAQLRECCELRRGSTAQKYICGYSKYASAIAHIWHTNTVVDILSMRVLLHTFGT